jgi:trehalose 6-phosphate synthase
MTSADQAARRQRLLTVSNRGPVQYEKTDEGHVVGVPGQGGLATALRVAAELRPMTWLSSPMTAVDRQIAEGRCLPSDGPLASRFVPTDPAAYDLFYSRFSNQVLWFLQHGLPLPENLSEASRLAAWQDGYLTVNRAFADAVLDAMGTDRPAPVMFHDYHFYTAPRLVKEARPDAYVQHFIHIPWPGPKGWQRLDRATVAAICDGLLGNDSLVFQTPTDARAFLDTCTAYLASARVDLGAGEVELADHTTRVWANAISVDPGELEEEAASTEFSRYRWLLRPGPYQKTILRVDRLDPTKNVVRGFEAYRLLLDQHPELRERVHFLAALVPGRSDIPSYQDYQSEAAALVAEINRRYGNHRWRPINLIFEHNRTQALAAMSLYDVLLVNPVADGMNLVAKEGPMLNGHDGVLVLSRRAGAWNELAEGALAIDPEDVPGTADALYQALTMSSPERRQRALALRKVIRDHDLRCWFTALTDDIDRNSPTLATTAA